MQNIKGNKQRLYTLIRETNMKSNGGEHNQLNIKKVEYYNILFMFIFGKIEGVELFKTYYVGKLSYQKRYIFTFEEFSSFRQSKGKKRNYIRVHFNEYMINVRSEINFELLKKVS